MNIETIKPILITLLAIALIMTNSKLNKFEQRLKQLETTINNVTK